MSRSARAAAKEKPKPAQPPQPIISPDIVPGKFTENDWMAMVEKDNAEDFVHDFIDEIMKKTLDRIYKLYVSKQLIPFTIFHAANEMMHIVQWKYVVRDSGEAGEVARAFWIQDKEPIAGVVDSWAQGAVPLTEVITSYLFDDDDDEETDVTDLTRTKKERSTSPGSSKGKGSEAARARLRKKKEMKQPKVSISKKGPRFVKYIAPRLKPKKPVAPAKEESLELTPAKVVSIDNTPVTDVTSSLSIKESVLFKGKSKRHRSSVGESMIASFEKLDPDSLPSHRVTLKFQIVNPQEETEMSGSQMIRRSTQINHAIILNQPSKPKLSCRSLETCTVDRELKGIRGRRVIPLECPPSVLETINVVPGVTVIEGGRTKRLTKRQNTKAPPEFNLGGVQPITSGLKDRSVSVADMLDRDSPIIRMLGSSHQPLPPISQPSSENNCPT